MTAHHLEKSRILLIANPYSGKCIIKKKWQNEIQPFLSKTLRLFDVEFTQKHGDATRIARQAFQRGCPLVIAMGGDGTLNEVINGYFENQKPINPQAAIGILPFGSGGDFIRTLGIERDYKKAIHRIIAGRTKKLDVGFISFEDEKFHPRYFINIANVGVVSNIMKRVNNFNRKIPAWFRYFSGTLVGFNEYKNIKVRLRLKPHGVKLASLTNLVVANGKYFGSGMCPTPLAKPDDGLFDIVILKNLEGIKFLPHLPELYTGRRIIPSQNIETLRASEVRVEILDNQNLDAEMDGETYGSGNLTFKIFPKAVRFVV